MKTPKAAQSQLFFSLTWTFLNEYMPKQVGRSPKTVASYRDSLSLFRQYLKNEMHLSIGAFRFADCTKDCVFNFRNFLLSNGNKPSSVNVRVAAIRAYLNYAADRDVAVQQIALAILRIPPCKTIETEKAVLSEAALTAILAAPPMTKMGMRDRAILITLYDSAMRLDELLSIRLFDLNIDSEYPCVLLHGKGNKERNAALTDKAKAHIKQYLQIFHFTSEPDAFLFSTTIKGETDKMSPSNVQRLIDKYADIARISCSEVPESVHPHMFRRTRATNLYQDGVALELVATILGHAQLETTKIYAKPSLAQLRESLESVPTPAAAEQPFWVGSEDEMARLCGLR